MERRLQPEQTRRCRPCRIEDARLAVMIAVQQLLIIRQFLFSRFEHSFQIGAERGLR
jgi:hypothetical protein